MAARTEKGGKLLLFFCRPVFDEAIYEKELAVDHPETANCQKVAAHGGEGTIVRKTTKYLLI